MDKKATKRIDFNTNQNSYFVNIAKQNQTALIVSFFDTYLHTHNPAIHSREFFCRHGVAAAIRRNSIIIAHVNHTIIGACRFYRRKDGDISLYQFAINEQFRGQHLLYQMLKILGNVRVHSKCPIKISFNVYYKKTGWTLENTDSEYYHWVFLLNNQREYPLSSR